MANLKELFKNLPGFSKPKVDDAPNVVPKTADTNIFSGRDFNVRVRECMNLYIKGTGKTPKFSVGKRVLIDISKKSHRGQWEYLNERWKNNIVTGTIKSIDFSTSFLEEVLDEYGIAKNYYSHLVVQDLRNKFVNGNFEALLPYCDWLYKIEFDNHEHQISYAVSEYWLVENFNILEENIENLKRFKALNKKVNNLEEKLKQANSDRDELYQKIFNTTEKYKV